MPALIFCIEEAGQPLGKTLVRVLAGRHRMLGDLTGLDDGPEADRTGRPEPKRKHTP